MYASNVSQHMAQWLRDLLVQRKFKFLTQTYYQAECLDLFMEYFLLLLSSNGLDDDMNNILCMMGKWCLETTLHLKLTSPYCVWWVNIQKLPLTWLWRNCWVNSVHFHSWHFSVIFCSIFQSFSWFPLLFTTFLFHSHHWWEMKGENEK